MRIKVLCIIVLAILAVDIHAEVIFNFSPSHLSSLPWNKTTFRGELRNIGAERVYLNGLTLSEPNASLVFDTDIYVTQGPVYLDPNESWSGDLFDVYNDIVTPLGDHFGTLTISGGMDETACDTVVLQNFQLTIQPVMDYSQNQVIDLPDLVFFVESWLASPCDESNSWCGDRDIDHLGSVNLRDFIFLAQRWLSNFE